ncbi:DUF6537 domain-containing protein [Hydrogenophaga sp. R2]|uniref:DUF6537 domain-containing protein n=1 Tax=Hydrogenophaga sp. R2 TaxID=3132827 RepID=UPI003CEAC44E
MSPSDSLHAPRPDLPLGILIAALGGEGGGVLADWLVRCALDQGLPVQATSVPGVAQRTGATSYYIELMRQPAADGRAPVFSLTPVPGCVDVVVASELLEAARMVERGFVTGRTTLLSSTHRVYTTVEKMHMADGRQDPQRLMAAATALARRAVLFDMEALTVRSGTVVSAVMFGALAGAGVLPWSREVCESVIRRSGKGVEASLAGFAAAFDAAGEGPAVPAAAPVAMTPALEQLIELGAARCADYQDAAYAERFREAALALAASAAPAGPAASASLDEAVRQLALWMCFEDVIRVAELKSRRSRFDRVRQEAAAREGELVRITEHFKPGIDELAAVLPAPLGHRLLQTAQRRGWMGRHLGLHIRSTSLWGFLMLRGLAALRTWRPRSLRFHQEHEAMAAWLAALHHWLPRSPALALQLAGMPQVLKGYGETQARGRQNYARLWATHVGTALSGQTDPEAAALALQQALRATLADPEGRLNAAFQPSPAARPVFWAAKAPSERSAASPP